MRVKRARAAGIAASEAHELASLLTLLADPLRARILAALLVVEEMCVGDLAVALDATEDAVSYGLRLLRIAGLVRSRRDGRMAYYRLSDGDAGRSLAATLAAARRLAELHPEAGTDSRSD